MNKYRHPNEWLFMALTFGILGLFTLVISILTFGLGLLLVIGGIAWLWFKVLKKSELDFYIYLEEEKNPQVVKLVDALRRKWRLGEIETYLNTTREINAKPTDFGRDFIILSQAMLDAIPGERHRRFVFGHELGHAGLWHGWLLKLTYYVDHYHEGTFIQKTFHLFLQDYVHSLNLSADRIGLISCNNLKAALEALVFIEIGQGHRSYPDVAKAVAYLSGGKSARNRKVQRIFASHPEVYQRVYQLSEFAREMKMV